ncbi:MAG TPA: selenocysteine-specific translation factor, partial [Chloroflexi bacterium]|nr:selenocysteine-specific translation factor [Chloroflexota bacterium]
NPIPLVKGDRFIIRIPSPPATVGGGVVVDPHPGRQHRRFRPEVIRRLNTLAQGSPAEILLQTLERSGPTRISDLQPIGSQEDTAEALAQLLTSGEAILLGDPTDGVADVSSGAARRRIVAARSWWEATTSRMMDLLSTYHREFPLRIGVGREALRSGLRLDARVFNALMERVTADGIVADEGANVRLPSHQIRFTPDQQRRVNALLDRFHRQPHITPSFKECVEAVGEDVLNVLIGRGDLIVVSPTVLFLSSTYQEICQRIREHIEMTGSITLAQTRDMLGTSRKYAQAILEYLDEIGVTRRKGDERVLASRK